MSKGREGHRNESETAERRQFVIVVILFLVAIAVAIYFGAAGMLPALEPVPSSAAVAPSGFEAGCHVAVDCSKSAFSEDA
jgi:hypothetical protein